jgi:hypothetical protein
MHIKINFTRKEHMYYKILITITVIMIDIKWALQHK